jgi:DNA repair protein RadC
MAREVTVAFENKALERASRRKTKLKWHRADGGGLKSSGERGEYCIVRQRADRRHGIYRWGVKHNGHDVGSTEDLAGAKGLAAHHEFKQSCAENIAPVASEESRGGSYRARFVKALRLMGEPDPEGFADRHEVDVERYELAGVEPNIAAAILMSSRHRRELDVAENGASESPTREEWEVIVTNPPPAHRGAILGMAPGDSFAAGNKIILWGFHDDEEAAHVAGAIARQYKILVPFGPKRKTEAAEDSHPGNAVLEERRRRPGAEPKEEPCEHGCPTGECKPFTKLSRDPRAFDACMRRAKEIGELDTSRKLYDLIHHELGSQDREVFGVVCIDFRGQLRDFVILSVGQRHRVAVDIEDILQVVILSGCDGFVVCHSHPSGNAEPSQADRQLTKSIEKAAAVACPNVKMVDHIVCGLASYYSFADRKLTRVKN